MSSAHSPPEPGPDRASDPGEEHPQPLSVLYTDLAGSTELYQFRGNATAHQLVKHHHRLLSEDLGRFEGTLVKTIGDSLLVTFPAPRQALECAIQMQQALQAHNRTVPPADRLQVRIGVHHGPVIATGSDVFGDAVKLAECIERQAPPGAIYTSLSTSVEAHSAPEELEPLGELELPGVGRKVGLARVLWDPAEIEKNRKLQFDRVLLPDLTRAIQQRKCVLVVGGAHEMERRLEEQLAKELRLTSRRTSLARLATRYEREYGSQALRNVLANKKLPPQPSAEWLQALARCPWDLVLSCGLDDQLEETLRAAGRNVHRFAGWDPVDLTRVGDGEVALIKLFGHPEDPSSLALTEAEIRHRLADLQYAPDALLAALATRRLLWVGFRWGSPVFLQLFEALSKQSSTEGPRVYGIAAKLSPRDRSGWEKKGLHLHAMEEGAFFAKLQEALEGKPRPGDATRPEQRRDGAAMVPHPRGWRRPYKFLSYFDEEDEQLFFGRQEETTSLFHKVAAHKLVLLHAPSGTGKSSLLNAGLVPRLKREGYQVLVRRALRDPEQEIREGIASLLTGKALEPQATLGELLRQARERLGKPLVIVLDQFEELFLRFSSKIRRAFAEKLGAILKDPTLDAHFVLALRHDFLSSLSELRPKIPSIFANEMRIENLTQEGMREAIEGPAKLAGITYQPGLVNQLILDLGVVGSEPPQLQILCDRLYDALGEGEREITGRHYAKLGGAKGILGSYLQRFLDTLNPAEQALCRTLLKALVTSAGTKRVVSAPQLARELETEEKPVSDMLALLQDARLIRTLVSDEGDNYELTHEYLTQEINAWIQERDQELKKARELLTQEMLNHQKFGWVMSPERRLFIEQHRQALHLTQEEEALLTTSVKSQRQRRYAMLGSAAGILILGILGSLWLYHTMRVGLCQGAQKQLTGIWDATTKQSIEKAFLSTNKPYAKDTYARVAQLLDTHTSAWASMHTEACQATQVHGTQSPQLLDLRMACLSEKRAKAKSLTDLFQKAPDEEVLQNAVQATLSLGDLNRCKDPKALQDQKPLPQDPKERAKVEQAQKLLLQASTLQALGKYKEGLPIAQQALDLARTTKHVHTQASAHYQAGRLLSFLGRLPEAENLYQKALDQAEIERDSLLESQAILALQWSIFFQGRRDEALSLHRLVKMAISYSHEGEQLLCEAHSVQGQIMYELGHYEKAREHHEQAIALAKKNYGKKDPNLGLALQDLALVLEHQGFYNKAKTYYEESLAIEEDALGSNHPLIANALRGLGKMIEKEGKCQKAKNYYDKALGITKEARGPDHPFVAVCMCSLGDVFVCLEQYSEAKSHYENAIERFEKAFGPDDAEIAWPLYGLGVVHSQNGRHKEAQQVFKKVLAIDERTLGKQHPGTIWALSGLGEVFLLLGDLNKAADYYRQVTSICQHSVCAPAPLGISKFGLAQILLRTGKGNAYAIGLARQAMTELEKDKSYRRKFAQLKAWLQRNEELKK